MKKCAYCAGIFFAAMLLPAFGQAPILAGQPVSQTNVLGDFFIFDIGGSAVNDTNATPFTYQWYHQVGNNNIKLSDDGVHITGSTTYQLYIPASLATDGGKYQCVVTGNGVAVSSTQAVLTLWFPPVIATQPTDQTVIIGSNVQFSVTASTAYAPTNFGYQWYQNGIMLRDDAITVGSQTRTLTLLNVDPLNDSGTYSVTITNGTYDLDPVNPATTVSSSSANLLIVVPPIITGQPVGGEVAAGTYFSMQVGLDTATTGVGIDPIDLLYPVSYQWRLNGVNISPATNPDATNQLYELIPAVGADAGNYDCIISNYGGVVTSSVANVIVDVPITITTQPASNTLVAVSTVTPIQLTVAATGSGPLYYQWYTNNILSPIPNATNVSYAFYPSSTNLSATYFCVVSNYFDLAYSADAVVTIRTEITPPTISFIGFPTENQRWSNSVVAVTNQAADVGAGASGVSFVRYQANGGAWSNSALINAGSGWWSFTNNPVGGSNTYTAQATDKAGNVSLIATRHIFYVVPQPFKLLIAGQGIVNVDTNWTGGVGTNLLNNATNSANLEIGRAYTVTSTPASSYKFVNWTGNGIYSTSPVLTFLMQTNLVITATFGTTNAPAIAITNPAAGGNFTNTGALNIQGSVTGVAPISAVMWKLNSSTWKTAAGTSNWTAAVAPAVGSNYFCAYGVDVYSNYTTTNILIFTNTTLGTLVVKTNGQGTITNNYNGQTLVVGQTYAMTAYANTNNGFIFSNWTGGVTASLSALTNGVTVSFVMQSNLTLQANFKDIQAPTVAITSTLPVGAQTNAAFTVFGTASDNDRVTAVNVQLNNGAWVAAIGTNLWTAAVNLANGTNTVRAYSVDAWGNRSSTNTLTASASAVFLVPPTISIKFTNALANVTFNTVTGATYRLIFRNAVTNPAWTTLSNTATVGTGVPLTLTDTNAPQPLRVYRVRVDAQ